ncbi:MAG TPA: hypothetical protein VM717_08445 [Chthoniobacterales bacterium]|nr:hypothetical protein [Chthoniobacterales bacterium]
MAAIALKGGCAHALGEEALQIGMNGAVLFSKFKSSVSSPGRPFP